MEFKLRKGDYVMNSFEVPDITVNAAEPPKEEKEAANFSIKRRVLEPPSQDDKEAVKFSIKRRIKEPPCQEDSDTVKRRILDNGLSPLPLRRHSMPAKKSVLIGDLKHAMIVFLLCLLSNGR